MTAEVVEENPVYKSNCGWCYTGQCSDCRPELKSQPKWKCDCARVGHVKSATVAERGRKRKV